MEDTHGEIDASRVWLKIERRTIMNKLYANEKQRRRASDKMQHMNRKRARQRKYAERAFFYQKEMEELENARG